MREKQNIFSSTGKNYETLDGHSTLYLNLLDDEALPILGSKQAQFASDMQQLQESQSRTDHMVAKTAELLGQTDEVVTRLANVTHAGFTDGNAKITALADAQIRTEENLMRTEKNVASITDSLIQLTAVVDRYLSGRNGK